MQFPPFRFLFYKKFEYQVFSFHFTIPRDFVSVDYRKLHKNKWKDGRMNEYICKVLYKSNFLFIYKSLNR